MAMRRPACVPPEIRSGVGSLPRRKGGHGDVYCCRLRDLRVFVVASRRLRIPADQQARRESLAAAARSTITVTFGCSCRKDTGLAVEIFPEKADATAGDRKSVV